MTRSSGTRRRLVAGPAGRTTLTVLVAGVIFVGVLPHLGSYSGAWALLRQLSWRETVVLGVVAVVNLVSYAPLWMAALPGVGFVRAAMTDQVSTALTDSVPAGFTVGVGVNAAMFHTYGFSAEEITRAIALSGIWNNLVKLGLPAAALVALVLTGRPTDGLVAVAVVGVVLLLLAVGVLVAVLAHPSAAALVSRTAERAGGAAARVLRHPRPTGWVAATDRFRGHARAFVRRRWGRLTAAGLVSSLAPFLLLLTCLRTVDGTGAQVPWLVVLAVFAVTRLVTLVPITPGALGVAELSYAAGLTAVGVGGTAATAVVLLFRFLTWFLPIPVGAACWLLYRHGAGADHHEHARALSAGTAAGTAA